MQSILHIQTFERIPADPESQKKPRGPTDGGFGCEPDVGVLPRVGSSTALYVRGVWWRCRFIFSRSCRPSRVRGLCRDAVPPGTDRTVPSVAAAAAAASDALPPLNILVAGAGDIRHVLQTMSRAGRHTSPPHRPLHFYVIDDTLECLARHLLLLLVATDTRRPVPERMHLWLELYGNARLRQKTRTALAEAATELLRMLAHPEEGHRLATVVDLSLLKHANHANAARVVLLF